MEYLLAIFPLLFIAVNPSESYETPIVNGSDFVNGLSLIKDGETYYMFLSSEDEGIHIYTSPDFQSWTETSIEMDRLNPPSWLQGEIISKERNQAFPYDTPSLYKINGTYLMYFSVGLEKSELVCLGVASAKCIHGPFVPAKNLLLCTHNRYGVFAPFIFEEGDKKVMFYNFVENGSKIGGIKARTLFENGLSLGEDTIVLTVFGDLDEDKTNFPCFSRIVHHKNYYYLFNFINGSTYVSRSSKMYGPYEAKQIFMAKSEETSYVLVSSFVKTSDDTYQFVANKWSSFNYSVSAKTFRMESGWPVLVNSGAFSAYHAKPYLLIVFLFLIVVKESTSLIGFG